jgi:hypothetical protein
MRKREKRPHQLGGEPSMVRWRTASKTVIALGAFASLLIGSGAGVRWGDLGRILHSLF